MQEALADVAHKVATLRAWAGLSDEHINFGVATARRDSAIARALQEPSLRLQLSSMLGEASFTWHKSLNRLDTRVADDLVTIFLSPKKD
ncbi:hypothetical protein [Kineococcus glutinatus]